MSDKPDRTKSEVTAAEANWLGSLPQPARDCIEAALEDGGWHEFHISRDDSGGAWIAVDGVEVWSRRGVVTAVSLQVPRPLIQSAHGPHRHH